MELSDSFLRVTFDPNGVAIVLLDYGDPLWDPVALDGRQVVQEAGLIRAAGIRAIPRGNERHTLSFSLCRIRDAMDDAFAARVNGMLALPRTMADVLISLEDGRGWRIKNAAISDWPGGQEERLTRDGVHITGGEIIADSGTFAPGSVWSADDQLWEY